MSLLTFLRDLIRFPLDARNPENRFSMLLQIICKDYPAYFWSKPSLGRTLVFPRIIIKHIFLGPKKKQPKN